MQDARGHTIALAAPPRRIVSLVPSQTELLADLGLENEVVGLTRFCVHPAHWKKSKRIIGGTKKVNVSRVQALQPDLILANWEENTQADVEALEAIAPVFVTDVRTVADALAMIRTVGALTHTVALAEKLATEVEAGFVKPSAGTRLRAAYLIWRAPYMTVGHDTFIHDVLHGAGFDNVFGQQPRYPTVSAQDLAAAAPHVVLLSSEPYPFAEKHLAELQTIVPWAAIQLVDGELFSWYGSRLRHTPDYVAAVHRACCAALAGLPLEQHFPLP